MDIEFIKNFTLENKDRDPVKLRLQKLKFKDCPDFDLAVSQIECRKKFKKKIPSILSNPEFIFPSVISGEQATSETVAKYHSSLISPDDTIIDMTAGLGIDSIFLAGKAQKVTSLDIDAAKAQILQHNARALQLNNLKVFASDSIEYLKSTEEKSDIIFVDPSRRDKDNKRTYNFHDCQPDIIRYQDLISSCCKKWIVKGSPMLDITQTLKDFSDILAVRTISLKGEMKEILLEIAGKRDKTDSDLKRPPILIEALDLNEGLESDYNFKFSYFLPISGSEINKDLKYAGMEDIQAGHFIYEPASSIMKLAPWQELVNSFLGLKKFSQSSHLFVSSEFIRDFPGRITSIEKIITKKDRKTLNGFPAVIISRNFPLSPDEIRRKFGIKEGDNFFLYASRIENKPIMIMTKTINPGRIDQGSEPESGR